MSRIFDAFFLEASVGRRFCLFHPPDRGRGAQGAVVYVHPFAEELNRSRRMAALQARALAAAGYAVLQIDLYGCGDSSGEFGEATWEAWVEDVALACAWLRSRSEAPLWLWGLRAGCLIAAVAALRLDDVAGFLFWQPVFSGRQHLQQFLRLKMAGDALSGQGKQGADRLRQQLAGGDALEIAGYLLSPGLAASLDQAELIAPPPRCRIECLEMSAKAGSPLSPPAAARLAEWRAAGHVAHGTAVHGPAFWQTVEIAECHELISATLAAIGERLA